jgi:DNA anti-recombination protein RmuC
VLADDPVRRARRHPPGDGRFQLARTSDEILGLLGGFAKEWERFCGQLDALGTSIERAGRAYDALQGTRRRQLQRQLDRIEDLRQQRDIEVRHAGPAEEPEIPRPAEEDGAPPVPLRRASSGP